MDAEWGWQNTTLEHIFLGREIMRRSLSILILGIILLLATVQPAQADTITVTTTVDKLSVPCNEIGMDDLPLPGGTSLREAMCIANNHSGEDTISFNLSGCSGTCTIQPIIGLPVLSDDGTTIDGYSQTGASPATATNAAQLVIVLDGQNVENFWGITIGSANNHITGLVIHSFGKSGIGIGSIFATVNLITGNFIGTTESGFVEPDLYGNQEHGIHIKDGAKNNTIGGD
jgi:hypothetical protein